MFSDAPCKAIFQGEGCHEARLSKVGALRGLRTHMGCIRTVVLYINLYKY